MDIQITLTLITVVGGTITAVVGGYFLLMRQAVSDQNVEELEREKRESDREARLDSLSKDIWNQFTQVMDLKDERIVHLEDQMDTVKQENEDMIRLLADYRKTVEEYKNKQKRDTARIGQLERDNESLLGIVDEQTTQMAGQETQIRQINLEMKALTLENETLMRQVKELQAENEKLHKQLNGRK